VAVDHGQHHLTVKRGLLKRLQDRLQEFIDEESRIDPKRARLLWRIINPSQHPLDDEEFDTHVKFGFELGDFVYRMNIDVGEEKDLADRVTATRLGADVGAFLGSLDIDEAILLIRLVEPEFHVAGLDTADRRLRLTFDGTPPRDLDLRVFAGPPVRGSKL
jgi:hypothetical protein